MDKDYLLGLLAKDQLELLLEELLKYQRNSNRIEETVILSARYYDIEKQVRSGTIDQKDRNLEINQIRSALVGLIRDINHLKEEAATEPRNNFFYSLPFDSRLGITTKHELLKEKFVLEEGYHNNEDEELYKLGDRLYGYIDKSSGTLRGLKIWNMPKLWVSNGIKAGMLKNEFTSILSDHKVSFIIKDYEYFEAIIYNVLDYEYYADFPKNDENYGYEAKKERLSFIVVNKSTNIEY